MVTKAHEHLHRLRGSFIVCLILALFAVPASSWASVAGKVRKGNKEYHRENYDNALREYRDAQLEDPESALLHYNIAAVQYKQEQWQEALMEYQGSLSGQERDLAAKTCYNMGNTLYRLGNLPEAIEAYKSALKIDPGDMDAKYNLELVQNLLEQQPEEQSQQSQDQSSAEDQQEQGSDQQEQNQKEEQQQKEQEQKEGQQEQQQDQKAAEGEREEEQQTPQPRKPGQMSEEEAQQLLNALQEQEKKAQEQHQRAQQVRGSKTDLDW